MRRQSVVFLLSMFLVLAATAIGQGKDGRMLVQDFTLTSSTGEEVLLSDFRGRIVVLNFWASWCPHCRAEMPDFQKLHDQFSEGEDVVLLLINQIDGSRETVETSSQYFEENGFTMTNLYDHYGRLGSGYFGVPGLPTTIVIDREGYFVTYAVGAVNEAIVLQMIGEAE